MSTHGTFTTPRKRDGIAGQVAVDTTVTYRYEIDGKVIEDDPHMVSLVGNTDGGPVVMVTGVGPDNQIFVDRAVTERIGFTFDSDPEAWVKAFFHDLEEVPS